MSINMIGCTVGRAHVMDAAFECSLYCGWILTQQGINQRFEQNCGIQRLRVYLGLWIEYSTHTQTGNAYKTTVSSRIRLSKFTFLMHWPLSTVYLSFHPCHITDEQAGKKTHASRHAFNLQSFFEYNMTLSFLKLFDQKQSPADGCFKLFLEMPQKTRE